MKGKAVKKLQRAFPKTPTKRAEVIKSLFKSISPKTKGNVTEHNIVLYNTLSQETLKLVANFYEDDSVSRVMPGKKDVISTKTNGTKEKKRKERDSYLMTFPMFTERISKSIQIIPMEKVNIFI